MTLPTSCKAIHATVTKDLGVRLTKVDDRGHEFASLKCNFYESAAAENNGDGYISVSWTVSKTANIASRIFGTVAGMSFGDEKSAPVSGLGDKAVAVTNKGVVVELGVLSGSSILTESQLQYDTPIPLARWTALAKDLLAGKA